MLLHLLYMAWEELIFQFVSKDVNPPFYFFGIIVNMVRCKITCIRDFDPKLGSCTFTSLL